MRCFGVFIWSILGAAEWGRFCFYEKISIFALY